MLQNIDGEWVAWCIQSFHFIWHITLL